MRHGEEQGSGGVGQVGREGEVGREGSSGARERQEGRPTAEEDPVTRSWVEVPLTKGKVAKIDRADMLIIGGFRWQAKAPDRSDSHSWYANRSWMVSYKKFHVSMHRWIMQPPPGFVVDHINGDGLDNRRSNLRICTQQQNATNHKNLRRSDNRKPYRGILRNSNGRWSARVKHMGVFTPQGTYDTPEEAARAYDRGARALHGKFATLNFPDEWAADAAD